MKAKTVKLPSGAEAEIKRPGVMACRIVLAALPADIAKGATPDPEDMTNEQRLAQYDYQIAEVKAYTGKTDAELDGIAYPDDFVALYVECEKLAKEGADALDPSMATVSSS